MRFVLKTKEWEEISEEHRNVSKYIPTKKGEYWLNIERNHTLIYLGLRGC